MPPQHQRWQYQAKAESLYPIAAAATPDIGWLVQHPVPVRREAFVQQGGAVFVDEPRVAIFVASSTTQVFPAERRQVQARADVPKFAEDTVTGWDIPFPAFVVRRKWPAAVYQPSLSFDVGQVRATGLAEATTAQVMQRGMVQVQGKADVPSPVAPPFGWFVQHPVAPRRQRRPEGSTVGGFAPLVSFSWHVPQTDLVRRKRFINTGGLASFIDKPNVSFSWHVPQSDLVRRKRQINHGGAFFVDKPNISFSWHVPQSDLVRRKRQVNHGGITFVDKPVVSYGWNVPQSDLIRRERLVNEGGGTFVQVPRVVFEWFQESADVIRRQRRPEGGETFIDRPREPSFDWNVQEPEPVRQKRQVLAEGTSFVQAPRVVFEWFQQASEPRRTPAARPEGGVTLGEPVTIDIDWLVQGPEPLPRGVRIQPEQVSTGQSDDVIVSFGWYEQHPEPLRRQTRPQGFITELVRPPDVFSDSWWQQYPDQTRSRPRRPFGGDFRVDVVAPEVVTMDKWYTQHFNPMLRLFRPPTNVVYPVNPEVTPEPPPFVLRPCLLLSDIYFNSLLPLPSGYFTFLEQRVSSAYVAPLDAAPVPSGWVRQDTPTPWNLAR